MFDIFDVNKDGKFDATDIFILDKILTPSDEDSDEADDDDE